MTEIEDKYHYILSPSGSKRWMTCAGSVNLIKQVNPPDTTSKYAAEGTVAHEIHEKCLVSGEDAIEYLGQKFTNGGFKFTVNKDMAGAVQESLDYIRKRISDAEDFGLRVVMRIEVRASLEFLGIEGLGGGTSDVVLLFFDGDCLEEMEVVDYKHGAGVAVEVKHNTQALCYGLGIMMSSEFNGQGIPDGIKLTISQPRAHHTDGRIRDWDITKDQLLNWMDDELVPKAKATHDPDATLVPSDEGCRFCPVAGQCPALLSKSQELAMVDFADDELMFPLVTVLTSDQKRQVMDHAGALRSFIVAVENQIKLEVDSGSKDYQGHYKLVRMKSNRKFLDDVFDPDFSPLLDHLDKSDFLVEKPDTLGNIEKTLKAKLKSDGIKGYVKLANEIMDDITEKPLGGLVIAPESDSRQGVQPSIVSDFTNLDD